MERGKCMKPLRRTIPIAKPLLGQEEQEAIKEVLESGVLTQGEKVRLFEQEFANYIEVKHAVAVSNGTLALDTALKALKIGPGDEVVTPAFSFIASSNCILYQGAKPVFADINPKTFNIDPSDVADKITTKTKAIICAHLFGQPADMEELKETAEDHKIALIEDAAQAHGAEYRGQKVGGIGTIGCFSFYATKNMTTGEGGMITTNDSELARRARLLRDHGQTGKYRHVILGYNYRMPEVCAAIGRVQLRKLEVSNKKRMKNAGILTKGIQKISGLIPPRVNEGVKHVFYQYVVRVEDDFPIGRDNLAEYLKKIGVGVAVHYPIPIYRQPLYRELGYGKPICPRAEDACKRVLSLPVHPAVTEKDIEYIIGVLEKVS
jgi:perosamine synthetase